MFIKSCLAASLACWISVSDAHAGTLVVSGGPGDIIYATNLTTPEGGNQVYARNLLGIGTNVAVLSSSMLFDGYPLAVRDFYASFNGVMASLIGPEFDAETVSDVDLLFLGVPGALGASQELAVRSVLSRGGTVYISALAGTLEAGQPGGNSQNTVRSLLTDLGSHLQYLDTSDYAAGTATGSFIRPDSLTAGALSIRYGLSAFIGGGTGIVYDPRGAVVSYEANDGIGVALPPPPPPPPPSAPVPEPETWIMMTGGLALAGALLRRRRAEIFI